MMTKKYKRRILNSTLTTALILSTVLSPIAQATSPAEYDVDIQEEISEEIETTEDLVDNGQWQDTEEVITEVDEGVVIEDDIIDEEVDSEGANTDGQMAEVNEEIEEADYSNRNAVNAANFTQLQNQINTAPTNGTLRTINITGPIVMTSQINIIDGRNIAIQSTGNVALTRTGIGRHFTIQANSSLTLGNNVTITGQAGTTGIVGGVDVQTGGTFTMTGGVLRNNRALSGGGVNVLGGTFIMESGTIHDNVATTNGGGVSVESNGTFIMEGGTISSNTANTNGGGVNVLGRFDMNDGTISDNTSAAEGGGVRVLGTFDMSGGTINGNAAATQGGGVVVSTGGTFDMNDGTISGNTAGIQGAGVQVWGTFIMEEGVIRDNTAPTGVGVTVSTGSTFDMNGGTISGNTAGIQGAGVQVWGAFTMNGGSISDNTAISHGSGVHVSTGGTFNIHGGTISGNTTSAQGGGVRTLGTFNMSSGTISDNTATTTGGGVHVASGTFDMNGGTISDNTATTGGGIHVATLSENNLTVGPNVQFSGNSANIARHPPADASTLFPNIRATSSSIFNHPLNNYDIGFTGIAPDMPQSRILTATRSPETGGAIKVNGQNLTSLWFFGVENFEIEAVPAPGYRFVEWTSSNGGSFANARSMSTVFTTPDANTTLTAVFEIPVPPTITAPEAGTLGIMTAGTLETFGPVTATGIPATMTFTHHDVAIQTARPEWLTVDETTGVITATPPEGTSGTFHIQVQASNGIGTPASRDFSVTVNNNQHPVTFIFNGGNVEGIITDDVVINADHGSTFGSLTHPTPTRPNWTRAPEWFTAPSGGTAIFDDEVIIGARPAYARWSANISFMRNDGTNDQHIQSSIVRETAPLGELPTPPTRAGYIFAGWNTEENGNGTTVTEAWVPTDGHQAIYAQWEVDWRLDVEIPTDVFFFSDQSDAQNESLYNLISQPEGFAITNASAREIYVTVEGFEHDDAADSFDMIEELNIVAQTESDVSQASEVKLISGGVTTNIGSSPLMVIDRPSQTEETATSSIGRFTFSGRVEELPPKLTRSSFNLVLGFGVE